MIIKQVEVLSETHCILTVPFLFFWTKKIEIGLFEVEVTSDYTKYYWGYLQTGEHLPESVERVVQYFVRGFKARIGHQQVTNKTNQTNRI